MACAGASHHCATVRISVNEAYMETKGKVVSTLMALVRRGTPERAAGSTHTLGVAPHRIRVPAATPTDCPSSASMAAAASCRMEQVEEQNGLGMGFASSSTEAAEGNSWPIGRCAPCTPGPLDLAPFYGTVRRQVGWW